MNPLFYGAIIKQERQRRSWSQSGLCKGICAVSYLSKIEQGKAVAGEQIRRLLFERLSLPWQDDTAEENRTPWEEFYDALLSGDFRTVSRLAEETAPDAARLTCSLYAPDFYLCQAFGQDKDQPLPAEFEPYLEPRQLALQRCLQGAYEQALRIYPCACCYTLAGIARYAAGNEPVAMEYLQTGYSLAAKEGYARLMLLCSMVMGNCYSNHLDFESMSAHYQVARRLAEALGETEELETIRYNTASTLLELGEYARAYDYFSGLKNPSALSLHKLAICCEKLGKPEQALSALAQADGDALTMQMCELVRYRLKHSDFLRQEEYGKLLLDCFARIRRELPVGYALFHLPWVLDYLTATRQYKQACELLREFPARARIT